LVFLSSALLLASCGAKQQSPEDFYAELVKAARAKNGPYMYDILDSAQRASIDTMIGMQMSNLDKLAPEERAHWDSLKGKSKREIYGKVITSDKGLSDIFSTDYKVLKVDTLIVVQIQHTGQEPNTIYLRPKKGTFEVATPPRPPEAAVPEGHPDVQTPGPDQSSTPEPEQQAPADHGSAAGKGTTKPPAKSPK
jgi:hypothetical protein